MPHRWHYWYLTNSIFAEEKKYRILAQRTRTGERKIPRVDHLNVAICEDNPSEAKRLLHLVEDAPFETTVTTFVSTNDLVTAYVPGLLDLVFMDIYLFGERQEVEPYGIAAVAAPAPHWRTCACSVHDLEHGPCPRKL